MRKYLYTLLALLQIAFLSGCKQENPAEKPVKLDKPEITVSSIGTDFVEFTWNNVEGASSYLYCLDGGEQEATGETSVTFNGLEPQSVHTFKVMAAGDGKRFKDSDWSEIEVTLQEEEPADSFLDIKVKELGATSVKLTVTPEDLSQTYYVRVTTSSEYEGYGSDQDVFDSDAEFFASECETLGMTLEQYLSARLDKGVSDIPYKNLSPSTSHVAYGYALDVSGNVLSGISSIKFVTEDDAEKKYEIQIEEIASSSVKVTITTAESTASCLYGIVASAGYNEFGDEEFMNKIIAENPSATPETTVPIEKTFDGLEAETQYIVYAFEYKDGNIGSALTRKMVTTKSETEIPQNITITVTDITAESANISYIPDNKETDYVYGIAIAESYTGLSDEEMMDKIVEEQGEFLEFVITKGDLTEQFRLDPDTEYIAYAFGYEYGKYTSNLFKTTFTSGHKETVEQSVEVKVSNITTDSAHVSFIPSNKEANYLFRVLPAEKYKGLDDEGIIAQALEDTWYPGAYLEKGDFEYDEVLNADTEYIALAFGYENDEASLPVGKVFFKTEAYPDPETEFKVYLTSVTSTSVEARVVPADKEMEYFCDLQPSENFAGCTDDASVAQAAIDYLYYSISYYLDEGVNDYPYTGLTPGKDYTLVIFGYDDQTETVTTKVIRQDIRTPEN